MNNTPEPKLPKPPKAPELKHNHKTPVVLDNVCPRCWQDKNDLEKILIDFYADWSGYPPELISVDGETAAQLVHAKNHQLEISTATNQIFALIQQASNKKVKDFAEAVKATFPDPDDDSQFSPDGAGGWDVPSYQLAIADCMTDIDQTLADYLSHKEASDE